MIRGTIADMNSGFYTIVGHLYSHLDMLPVRTYKGPPNLYPVVLFPHQLSYHCGTPLLLGSLCILW